MSARHAFLTHLIPPLCGQKDRTGRHFLPASKTTTDPLRVTCQKCWTLLANANGASK